MQRYHIVLLIMEAEKPMISFRLFLQIYQYLCVALSITLVIYVFMAYLQNTDISRVEYVKFQSTERCRAMH